MAWDPASFGKKDVSTYFMLEICHQLSKNKYKNSDNFDDIINHRNKIYPYTGYQLIIPDDVLLITYRGQEIIRLDRCRTRLPQFSLSKDEMDKANALICLIDEF